MSDANSQSENLSSLSAQSEIFPPNEATKQRSLTARLRRALSALDRRRARVLGRTGARTGMERAVEQSARLDAARKWQRAHPSSGLSMPNVISRSTRLDRHVRDGLRRTLVFSLGRRSGRRRGNAGTSYDAMRKYLPK